MPKLWGLHHCVMAYNQLRDWKGKTFPFQAIPFDARMGVGDFVYLIWGDESLYGWGMIEKLTPDNDGLHQAAAVRFIDSEPPGPSVPIQIKNNALFANWDNLKEEGCLSRFNDDQLRYLNSLMPHGHPPDPDEVRENAAVPPTLRPIVQRFVQGQRIPFDETRFDEFKTITSPNVVGRIMDELEPYVLGYLCLEDRRDETICRFFFGESITRDA